MGGPLSAEIVVELRLVDHQRGSRMQDICDPPPNICPHLESGHLEPPVADPKPKLTLNRNRHLTLIIPNPYLKLTLTETPSHNGKKS